MKLKASTFGLVIAAVLLGGVAYYAQSQSNSQSEQQGLTQLFGFEENQVQALTIKKQQQTLSFQKTDKGWEMTAPDKTAASDAAIAYILNLLATGTSDRTLTVPAAERQTYGLQQPLATVEVTLDNKQTHRLVVGGYNFNRSSLYAQADPSATPGQNLSVLLVSPDFETAVNRPLAEWKQSSASPSPTGTPTPQATSSPAASPSPTPSASSPSPSPTPSGSPTSSSSPIPSSTPTPSNSPTPSGSPTP